MLIQFSVKNFRNFCDWTTFDLTTDKRYTFNENAVSGNVIRHAMLYGGNGEGKSNLGLAMNEIATHLNFVNSRVLDYKNHYLNADSAGSMAEFKYHFVFNGTKVQYHYGKKSSSEVVYEKLWINDELVIEWMAQIAGDSVINLEGSETLEKTLSQNVISALVYVKNNSRLTDNRANNAFMALFEFVSKMIYVKTLNRTSELVGSMSKGLSDVTAQIVNSGVDKFEAFLNELGISCQLAVHNGLESPTIVSVHRNRKIVFFETASSGTIALAMLYCWLERMDGQQVSFAYVDEFDAFYHQKLAKTIVKRISKIVNQTVLSTHNTGVMSNDLLRPDCYFELKSEKIEPLYALSDRELRKAHNLEKLYRAGAFDE